MDIEQAQQKLNEVVEKINKECNGFMMSKFLPRLANPSHLTSIIDIRCDVAFNCNEVNEENVLERTVRSLKEMQKLIEFSVEKLENMKQN